MFLASPLNAAGTVFSSMFRAAHWVLDSQDGLPRSLLLLPLRPLPPREEELELKLLPRMSSSSTVTNSEDSEEGKGIRYSGWGEV